MSQDFTIGYSGHPSLVKVCDWFELNGIDTATVKANQTAHVDDEAMTVTFDAFVVSIKGQKVVGPVGLLVERVTLPIEFLPSHIGLAKAA